ncbi:replication initiation factor domain-containing protein [Undibacterium sp. SXout20W]|uniref:replication initiation factor domain-containing protein n=1 Tax=Undibacterium sp. SXout20W TaxID=3413051 RepID=UPI003BEFF267
MKRLDDDLHNKRGTRLPARSASEDGQAQCRVQSSKKQALAPILEPLRDLQPASEVLTNRTENDDDYIRLILADGVVKQELKRSERDGSVFIDWTTITLRVTALLSYFSKSFTDEDIARFLSGKLEEIFGSSFGISKKNNFGLFFHPLSFVIGDNFGHFCIGNKNGRCVISISGQGWANASQASAKKLYTFITNLDELGGDCKLSRIDLAADYYKDGPTHSEFEAAYHRGEFVRQQRHIKTKDAWPNYQVYGCVHTKRGLESGITDAVGVRTSDLYLRRYDKGRELGDLNSTWSRVELEMKSKDTLIPFDVLLNPAKYFCQYPYLKNLCNSEAERLVSTRITAEITIESAKKIVKRQFGKYLRVLRGLAESDEELINELQSDEDEWPVRLAKIAPQIFVPIHKQPVISNVLFAEEFATSDFGYTDDSGYISSHIN